MSPAVRDEGRGLPLVVWLARATAAATFVLLVAGGLVTSQGVGMAVPDWPTTFGYNMFAYPLSSMLAEAGVFFEHSHRLIGSVVGMLTVGLALLLVRSRSPRWMKVLGGVAVALVIVQGVLGGMRVLLDERLLAAVHGCVAHAFFALMVSIAVAAGPRWRVASQPLGSGAHGVRRRVLALATLLYVQVVLGAVLRHLGGPSLLRLAPHLVLGLTVLVLAFVVAERVRQDTADGDPLRRAADRVTALLVMQVALGMCAYLAKLLAPDPVTAPAPVVLVTVAHQVNGAAIFASAVVLAIEAARRTAPDGGRVSALVPLEGDLVTTWTLAMAPARSHRLADLIELTKARLVLLVLLTTLTGYYMALDGPVAWATLLATLIGTSLAGAGSQVLNQVMERESDARMMRTRMRPLPDGRIGHGEGLLFGAGLCIVGIGLLWAGTHALAAMLCVATVVSYLGAYTPLKSRSPIATLVGCVPGAIPPMIGWAAARGSVDVAAASLFAILFFWQVPHSLAIGWLYRADYARAGTRILPVVDPSGRSTGRQVVLGALALVGVGLLPHRLGLAGWAYFGVALLAGLGMLLASVAFAIDRSPGRARRVLIWSYVYLPLAFAILTVDKLA